MLATPGRQLCPVDCAPVRRTKRRTPGRPDIKRRQARLPWSALEAAAAPFSLARAMPGDPTSAELLSDAGLRQSSDRIAGGREADLPALGSAVVRRYSAALIAPQLALRVAGIRLETSPALLAVSLADGVPASLALTPALAAWIGDTGGGDDGFAQGLIDGYARPLVAGVRSLFGTPVLVAAAMIAVHLETLLRLRGAQESLIAADVRAALAALADTFRIKTRSLIPSVRAVDLRGHGVVEPYYRRRVCCLADKLGHALCVSCPKQSDAAAAAALMAEPAES